MALPIPNHNNYTERGDGNKVIRLVQPHPRQQQVLENKSRFKVVVCGRRWGKTEVAKIWAVERALRGKVIWWILPNYSYATEVWQELKEILHPIRVNKRSGESQRKIILPGGGSITVKSAHDPDALRGRGLDGIVMDEAAMIPTEDAWETLRPALSDRQGEALFLTTPKGRNWLFKLWMRGVQGQAGYWSLWSPTWESPTVPIWEIEQARLDMTEQGFRQEYAAAFLRDAGAVFRMLSRVLYPEPLNSIERNKRRQYVMGVDWGQSNDFTAITVMDIYERKVVAVDRFNKISWGYQRDRLKGIADRWQPYLILAEENSIGNPNIEALQVMGLPVLPFHMSNQSKGEVIRSLSLAIEQQNIWLPNWDVLLGELQAYQQTRLASGRWQFGAPQGLHDDTVISTALAHWAMVRYPNPSAGIFH